MPLELNSLENIILGTAQWGLDYGISNKNGKTSLKEIKSIIKFAEAHGCKTLDTAASYGNSEEIIGCVAPKTFSVVTKLPAMRFKIMSGDALIKKEVERSLNKLGRSKIFAFLLHDVGDLLHKNANEIFRQLEELKQLGYVSKIGLSAYSFDEANTISKTFPIDIIQLPLNILNLCSKNIDVLDDLKSRQIEIHARSIFLQGLLLMEPGKLPPKLEVFSNILSCLKELALEQNVSLAQYLMRFLLDRGNVDKVIMGVENLQQLSVQIEKLPQIDYSHVSKLQFKHKKLLDPRNW